MTRQDLQSLSLLRLTEAEALLNLEMYSGSYYLGGYAVECALKACIAKRTQQYEFPDKKRVDASYTHNLRDLVRVAELTSALSEQIERDLIFRVNWDLVQAWSEQSRYRTSTQKAAQDLFNALINQEHGVMTWIKQHW